MESTSKWYTFSSFKLKIAAMLFMTIDHLGFLLCSFMQYIPNGQIGTDVGYVFRYIGRLAMPLFAFMIVEGVLHTKNYKKYALRLGLMAIIISIGLAVCYILSKCGIYSEDLKQIYSEGNIFIDLLLGSFMIFALKNKNKYFKLLALIPVAISILSFTAKFLEINRVYSEVYWFPAFLRLQYDWLIILLIGALFLGKVLTKMYYDYQEKLNGVSVDIWKENGQYQKMDNLSCAGMLVIVGSLYFALSFLNLNSFKVYADPSIQVTMICAAIFILLYNGTRGYNKKWFNILAYLYYPLHLVVLGIIFVLIFGV